LRNKKDVTQKRMGVGPPISHQATPPAKNRRAYAQPLLHYEFFFTISNIGSQAGNKFLCTQMTYRGVAATQSKGVVLAIGPPCKGFA